MKYLKQRGVSTSFIGKFAHAYFGVARSTIYRHVGENRDWYNEQERRERIIEIENLLSQGFSSGDIARLMQQNLGYINKIIVDNHLSAYGGKYVPRNGDNGKYILHN